MREENLTDKEWKALERKWAEDEQSDWAKYLKEERNKKARETYQKRKEALNETIIMPEESKELSEYERIREMNIKERNEALAAAGFDWKPSCN